jgi:PadR family transcriptional regulator, regulatory protein PadR
MPREPNTSPQTQTLLQTLLEQPQTWQHGYDLSKRTNLKSGTLYPILARLEASGFLESTWLEPSTAGKPPRHAYRLTADGTSFALQFQTKPKALTTLKTSQA